VAVTGVWRSKQLILEPSWRYICTFCSVLAHSDLSMQVLLDFSRDFDVSLMDKVAMAFYRSTGAEVRSLSSRDRLISYFSSNN
jgi:hypothetical protein